jgi:hypothetical protein
MPIVIRSSYVKHKALKLITPERANELDIPAEAPVFISPYVTKRRHCNFCHKDFSPLIYQVGQTTTAQHTCKTGGGGIYVRLSDDTSKKWIYYDYLWTAIVNPHGPIRMGNDRGYQYESVTPVRMAPPTCHSCRTPINEGDLFGKADTFNISDANLTLVAICKACIERRTYFPHVHFGLWETDWTFHYDGTEIRFGKATQSLPSYEQFMANTSRRSTTPQ